MWRRYNHQAERTSPKVQCPGTSRKEALDIVRVLSLGEEVSALSAFSALSALFSVSSLSLRERA